MGDERETNERGREQLQEDLADERGALLTVASGVEEGVLTLPTRNPAWAVRDVLAHVPASDADLLWLLEEASRSGNRTIGTPGLERNQWEMVRWTGGNPEAFARELRERGDRWRELLAALPDAASSVVVRGDWWPQDALSASASAVPESSSRAREFLDVVADLAGARHSARGGRVPGAGGGRVPRADVRRRR